MKIATYLVAVVFGVMLLAGSVQPEERTVPADLTYSELISYGIVNAYSMNLLVQVSFQGGTLPKADALDAVERNIAFVKALHRYANVLKRSSKERDEGMTKLINDMCEVSTYLEEHTQALKDWINDTESKSARRLYNQYSDKLEKRIELMLRPK